jgi:GNAT superfamily N-acetyltransferase
MAEGYTLRSTRPNDEDDCQRVADLLNAAFNRTFHTAKEFCMFATHSPSFRHDLNLVAEAPIGSFAALVGVTYDEANCRGIFEPVCTHPDHRRKGLARALMVEGLHRLKALGATDVYVETGDAVPANELYDAVGFAEAYRGHVWRKMF